MNEHETTPTPASSPESVSAQALGVSRRRLVRAGLTAAPVLTALHSNTVLAGGGHSCIRPSTFSSLKLAGGALSRGREIRTDYECASHGYWKNKPFMHKKEKFLSYAGFSWNPGGTYSGKSFQDVLEMKGNDGKHVALARHVVAAYLSAVSVKNDPDRVLLTTQQCFEIWNGQGNWSPFGGANWNLDQTMNYFEKVFG